MPSLNKNSAKSKKIDLVKQKLRKTVTFDQSLLTNDKFSHDGVVHSMKPEDFTMDYYRREGLEKVLVFSCEPEDIGMKVPPNTFTPRNVMEKVGENRAVQFISVATQEAFTNSFKAFVEYYETPPAHRIATYNVISLEVSGTEMVDLVQAPALVRQIDLASYWPDARKQRRTIFETQDSLTLFSFDNKYPRVENYCLMSASSSYTGFHIDFHGSSVWYHVLRGQKVFFIIEPTDENIRKYEEYLLSENDTTFFGDQVEKCTRVVVEAGQTLMLPAGWIHAVFTPVDSLVFGGNFIHPRSLKMQMKIVEHEEKLELQKREKYPHADEVFLHYMDHVVEKATGRRHIRPTPRNHQREGLMYVGEKYIEEGRHRIIPQQHDYDRRRKDAWANRRIEECQEYMKTKRIIDKYNDVDGKISDLDDFFFAEDPLLFFHPKHFEIEASFKGTNPCGQPIPQQCRASGIPCDEDILQQLIHPSEVVQWESLLEALLDKKHVNVPEGLTRPNSLVYTFFCLLKRLRRLNEELIDPTKMDIPKRTAKLHRNWIKRAVKKENEENKSTRDHRSEPPQKRVKQEVEEETPCISSDSITAVDDAAAAASSSSTPSTIPAATTAPLHNAAEASTSLSSSGSDASSSNLSITHATDPLQPPSSRPKILAGSALCAAFRAARAAKAAQYSASGRFAAASARAAAGTSKPNDYYTEKEDGIIVEVCRKWLEKQLKRKTRKYDKLGADENLATIRELIPHRSLGSIRGRVDRLKEEGELKRIKEEFGFTGR